MNTNSNKFYKTSKGYLAEEIHDDKGQIIGGQIICHVYPLVSDRLRMPDNTYKYRLKVEDSRDGDFYVDCNVIDFIYRPINIRHKLARRAILPIPGMDRRFHAYLKQIGMSVKDTLDERPWYPINKNT